uniref:Uncharacterized protein n=1 Tax=Musa acuminata subsp. malaccensis TaxID=214687 RepID=A0A804L5L5_MUSAM|nr:PREDICTED: uncharacterized protein LOC103970956 [Musa acuminata subsp. malaccensis]
MAPENQEHTAFITDLGVYFYKVMPFGLKNAGATYQRAVNKMFAAQIGRNVEVYVDDMIVKSRMAVDHLIDLVETFSTLRKYGLRLNPAKCTFGVGSGRFLGFIVHERGIDVNPEKCEEAFGQVKRHLANLPRLASVVLGEKLNVYLAASQHAVSSVLTKEVAGEQLPVYYANHVLNGPEEQYPSLEKLALALVLASRKLRPYFEAHTIEVITDQPLRQVLSKFDVAGRLLKWSVELGEFDIHYVPRTVIKTQSVADFIAELADGGNGSPKQTEEAWDLHVDGSATSSSAVAGLVLSAPDGRSFERSLRFGFRATKNEAEYEALLAKLKLALEMQVDVIRVFTDSQLVAEQLSDGYEAREPTMERYLAKVKSLVSNFSRFTLSKVSRNQNERADKLAKMALGLDHGNHPGVEDLPSRTISVSSVAPTEARTTWVQEMLLFKRNGVLPDDEATARRIRRTQAWYSEVNGRLYKRSFSQPLLRCLEPSEAKAVLAEVHEGICGEHIAARTLAYKILRQGYYWPTMSQDARIYVQRCGPCQWHARTPRQSAVPLSPIDCAWPFAQWGLDLLGPFPPASGQRRYIVVGVDYFTKWTEAEPLATITERQVEKFVWKSIVTRFGLPEAIITYNGSQFTSARLKRRVSAAQSAWVDELPSILWSLRTTPKAATRESPYSLSFGTEAVLPPEMIFPTLRTASYDEQVSTQGLRADLDLLEERRANAHLKDLSYKRAVARIYNRKVRPRPIKLDDLVLRRAEVSDPTRARGKLAPNWEGPYRVIEVIRVGAYRLATMQGHALPKTWNSQNLKRFFL